MWIECDNKNTLINLDYVETVSIHMNEDREWVVRARFSIDLGHYTMCILKVDTLGEANHALWYIADSMKTIRADHIRQEYAKR